MEAWIATLPAAPHVPFLLSRRPPLSLSQQYRRRLWSSKKFFTMPVSCPLTGPANACPAPPPPPPGASRSRCSAAPPLPPQMFLLCMKAQLENVRSISLPLNSQYCLTVRRPDGGGGGAFCGWLVAWLAGRPAAGAQQPLPHQQRPAASPVHQPHTHTPPHNPPPPPHLTTPTTSSPSIDNR